MNKYSLVKVVWYDGTDAYVSKFVLRCNDEGAVDEESKILLENYLHGNGEILHYDVQCKLDLEDICDMRHSEDAELACAFERFNEMYFKQ